MSPVNSAEGSAGLPFDTAPLPLVVGPFAMIAISPSLPARKKEKAMIRGMSAKEAASSPALAMVEEKGYGKDEEEGFKEERWKNERSISGHACGRNPPELFRSILGRVTIIRVQS